MSEVLALKMSIMLYDKRKLDGAEASISVILTNRRVAVVKLKVKNRSP
jgi:hypothetical protein